MQSQEQFQRLILCIDKYIVTVGYSNDMHVWLYTLESKAAQLGSEGDRVSLASWLQLHDVRYNT